MKSLSTSLTTIGFEEARAEASRALHSHDDRQAATMLIRALGSPNQRLQASALAELQLLLQRVRGAVGFRDFCEIALRQRLLNAETARSYRSIAELQLLAENVAEGTATEEQAFRALKAAHDYLLDTLRHSPGAENKLAALLVYLNALDFASTSVSAGRLCAFCVKHEMNVWADNTRKGCLLPVTDVRQLLVEQVPATDEIVLPPLIQSIKTSLEMFPSDPEATDLADYLLELIETHWSDPLAENLALLFSTYAAIEQLENVQEVNPRAVRKALESLHIQMRGVSRLTPESLQMITVLSNENGTTQFLRKFVSGQAAFYRGDYTTALQIFNRLLHVDALNDTTTVRVLQWSAVSALARIKACSAFEISPRQFLEDANRRLHRLHELDTAPSPLTAKLFLDFAIIGTGHCRSEAETLKGYRRVVAAGTRDLDPEDTLRSEYVYTLIRSAPLVDLPAREMLEEVAQCTRISTFAKMSAILAGDEKLELPEELLEEGDKEAQSETRGDFAEAPELATGSEKDNLTASTAQQDLQWFRDVLQGVPSQELAKEALLVVNVFLVSAVGERQAHRDRILSAQVALEVVNAFVRERSFKEAAQLLEFTRLLATGDSPEEHEVQLQIENLQAETLFATGEHEQASQVLTDLQNDLLAFISDRTAGELTMRIRNLLGHVNRQLHQLRGRD